MGARLLAAHQRDTVMDLAAQKGGSAKMDLASAAVHALRGRNVV